MIGHRVLKMWRATTIIKVPDKVTIKNIPKKSISPPKCKTIKFKSRQEREKEEDRLFPFLL